MSPSGAEVIRQIKQQVEEVDPAEVSEHLGNGVTLVDVRESEEWDRGHIPGAVHVPRGYLESRIDGAVGDRGQRVVLYCASGQRSALAAHTLTELLGYTNVASMTGGITLWKDRGYKVDVPKMLTPEQKERYGRHLLLPEVGPEGQAKLLDAKVLLLGAWMAWALPRRCIWPPPAWAHWGSSTTTTSTSPTSSARSSTTHTASGRPRSTRPRQRSPRSIPT